jgi:hypothetical protein
MKNKCIIFGAGIAGRTAYYKLSLYLNIVAYADNNHSLWGTELNGIKIINPDVISNLGDVTVIICSDYYPEIAEQLAGLCITDVYIVEPTGYMIYKYTGYDIMSPVSLNKELKPFQKNCATEKNILFVQQFPCVRTHKFATVLSENGYKVYLAYTADHPALRSPGFAHVYSDIFTITSMKELTDFVRASEFDIVHSSNEPDNLTDLLLTTGKKVVHDTHDFMSLNYKVDMNALALEYIANTQSNGCIYVNERNREIALDRFGVDISKTLIIENMPLDSYISDAQSPKLSQRDGELHCVYEGGVNPNSEYYRFFEGIWKRIADEGIHIHFYSQANPAYCEKLGGLHKNIHYEGALDVHELLQQMTKYDIGISIFNTTDKYRTQLESTSPNKIYDYLCSGLPVAVGDIVAHKNFVKEYGVGMEVNLDAPIYPQLKQISEMKIDRHLLTRKKLTFNSHTEELIRFYSNL